MKKSDKNIIAKHTYTNNIFMIFLFILGCVYDMALNTEPDIELER